MLQSLSIREKSLGAEHPEVATSLNSLAVLYYLQGRYAQAEPLFRRAIAIQEKGPGAEHPRVAQTLMNYAALLRKTKRKAEATNLLTQANAILAKHIPEGRGRQTVHLRSLLQSPDQRSTDLPEWILKE
jgi:tetratricopeptide (TPR) repeat protein